MKFIDFLQEDGEISTANVAGARGSLFGGIIKRTAKGTKFKKIPKITKLSEDVKSNTFASTDVISKLDDAEKSNEMKAIPEILNLLALENTLVTIDAMGCHTNSLSKKGQ
jgi:hypothetical protein